MHSIIIIYIYSFKIYLIRFEVNQTQTTVLNTYKIARQENFTQKMVKDKYVIIDRNFSNYCRHRIPPRSVRCSFCNALI